MADAVTRTARRIYLFGKQVGETNIFVFGANGEQIASLDLAIERDVAGLEEYLKRFIPNSDITVELINDNVVLTGTVETPLDAQRAQTLAPDLRDGRRGDDGPIFASRPPAASPDGGVDIDNPDQQRQHSQIVNLLQIIGEDQVTLKVTVAEVSRSVMKQLGVNMIGFRHQQRHHLGRDQRQHHGAGQAAVQLGSCRSATSMLNAYVNAMEQAGVMKTLAEPTLTAVSGEKATFKVGGEFNLVTSQDSQGANR